MRILHFLPSLRQEAGGPVRAVTDLTAALAARGHDVAIATTKLPDDLEAKHLAGEQLMNGQAQILPLAGPYAGTRPLSKRAHHQLRDLVSQYDVVHVHGVWNYSNVQVGWIAQRLGKAYIVSVRGMLDDWTMQKSGLIKAIFLATVGRKHLGRAGAVHLTAEAEKDQATKRFQNERAVVIPNLLDLDPFRTPPGPGLARAKFSAFDKNEPVVLFLSRIHEKKGAEVLLQAASLLHGRGTRLQYIFAGAGKDGYVADLRERAQRLGLGNRTHFVGHVKGEMKVSLYQASLCLALPTFQENFGFVFPEAMAAGTPVITTKGVDIWPTLERGGGIIAERTPDAFADAMAKLASDIPARDALGQRGREFVMREYAEDNIVQQFEALYKAVLVS
jgi:glycosyltransferase involved in cell wall biosynthesis